MPLSPTQEEVLDAIREYPGQTVRALMERADMPLGTISGCIKSLREKGLVMPNPDRADPNYGLLFPMESQCPAPATVDSTLALLRDDLAMVRDLAKHAVSDLGTLATAAGIRMDDPPSAVEAMAIRLRLYPILEQERNDAMDKVAGLNHKIRDLQLSCNRGEDALAEISSLCLSLGFSGSGDVLDQVLWLLTTLGGGEAVHAFRRRQLLQAEVLKLEAESLNWRTVAREWVGKAQALRAVGPCPWVGE